MNIKRIHRSAQNAGHCELSDVTWEARRTGGVPCSVWGSGRGSCWVRYLKSDDA